VYVPVAVNCCVVPSGIEAVAGLIAIDTRAAAVTVSCVLPLMVPEVAVMLALPVPTLVANPCVGTVLLIVPVVVVSDDHVTIPLRFCVLPSVNVPVAVNCWLVPNAIEGSAGVTAIETNAAAVTVSCVVPLMDPLVAVMLAVPVPSLLTNPGVVVLITPTAGVSELHCTVLVRFCVVPSVKLPVAVNCCVVPIGMVGIAGVTVIETSTAGFTVNCVLPLIVAPLIVATVAVTVVLPTPALVAIPCAFTVAIPLSAVLHVAVVVNTRVLPSL
jgi:hypothetical protein